MFEREGNFTVSESLRDQLKQQEIKSHSIVWKRREQFYVFDCFEDHLKLQEVTCLGRAKRANWSKFEATLEKIWNENWTEVNIFYCDTKKKLILFHCDENHDLVEIIWTYLLEQYKERPAPAGLRSLV